ncbi:MAG: anhydro-N-acetylmuramic acid kinase, partial [Bacteroidetes bacterium]|nr:anhydro-N-acetylmuramic acid kinase [Bacteroidota bacterium]
MKQTKLVVGLMSGTSLDGIDAALLRVRGTGSNTRFKQLAFVERAFPPGLRKQLLQNSVPETSRVDEIAQLNVLLAELYADAVTSVAQKAGVNTRRIDLIGSHGQTIHHLPKPRRLFGKTVRATLQIGDPSVLAAITVIVTVGDFRLADMAVGGQGAPLVPYFDWLVFRSSTLNRLLLNIGGIANITMIPKNCRTEEIIAFDTGPGNMVVDSLMHEFYGKRYDHSGKTAASGAVSLDLFDRMARHPYLKAGPPKSTGREEFGSEFVEQILRHGKRYDREDIIATASQFTAYAVYDAYRRFVAKRMRADEVIVSGGGAKNRFFLDELSRYFSSSTIRLIDEFGMSADSKEAV